MKTILDLLAKFAETQTLAKEDKELLQAKFSELSEDDKTEDLSNAVGEATAEVAEATKEDEVVTANEDESSEGGEDPEEGKADEVTIKASEYESMKKLATQASKLIRESRKNLVKTQVGSLAFSETNKKGVILPKMIDGVVDFALSLSEAQTEKFLAIIGKFQSVAASEVGHDGTVAEEFNADEIAFFTDKLGMSKEDAMIAAREAKKL